MCRIFMLTATVCLLSSTLLAGVGTYEGTEEGFWKGRAVVLARVKAARAEAGPETISVRVLGVAATDSYVPAELAAVPYRAGRNSALRGFPAGEEGVYALCLYHRDGTWSLDPSYLKFFESGCAMEKVDGADDPKFKQLLESIARVRSKK